MTTNLTETPRVVARDVTPEEAEFYRENGWVHLENLISEEDAGNVLEHLQAQMGDSGTAGVRTQSEGMHARPDHIVAMWRNYEDPLMDDAWIESFAHSKELGRAARTLMGQPVRFWRDEVLVKMPAADKGAKTPWHQDWPYMPHDRTGFMGIWISLRPCPPERGALRFLSKSKQAGVLGRSLNDASRDLVDTFPELLEAYEISPALNLGAGDATVHDGLTVHYAPKNETADPRWAYLTQFFPASTLYTGAPQRLTDQLDGLKVNEPFEHERFPVIDD